MRHLKSSFPLLLLIVFFASFDACDLIDPEEKIPSFLQIDSISFATSVGQGSNDANIVDAWVYNNGQLVGTYELPATIPVLAAGETPIRISAGIKLNGQVGHRIQYRFTEDFLMDLELFPDSELHINPTVSYHDAVVFEWLEDFEDAGFGLAATDISESEVVRVGGAEAYEGQSAKFSLDAGELFFECKASDPYVLPGGGNPVFLEFMYRCDHTFAVGLFSRDPGGTLQTPLLALTPTEDWNYVYVNLTDVVSSNATFIEHWPYFGFFRANGFEEDINVYIDNIRLIH